MPRVIAFIVFILLWTTLSFGADNAFFVGLPTALGALWELFLDHGLMWDVLVSFRRIVVALLLVFFIAIPFGILIGRSTKAEKYTEPITRFLRYIPAPTLIPLGILWFGVGETTKIFLIFWGVFFVSLLAIRDAAQSVDEDYILAAKSMGYSPVSMLFRVVFPSIAPDIWNALRIAWGEAWIYLLIAEIVAADHGVGKVLIVAQRFLRVDQIFGLLILLGFIGLLSDLFFKLVRRYLFAYRYEK